MVGLRDNLRPGMDTRRAKPVAYPTMLERRYVLASQLVTCPLDATYVIARAVGPGGYVASTVITGAAGGGAWAKSSFTITPGEILDCQMNAFQSNITRGGKFILFAGGGDPAIVEGQAASGGRLQSTGHDFGRTGTAAPNANVGGNCLGDIGDIDSINLWGRGATGASDAKGYGGGATKLNGVYKRETPGLIVLEFYDRDPKINY